MKITRSQIATLIDLCTFRVDDICLYLNDHDSLTTEYADEIIEIHNIQEILKQCLK